MRKISNIIFALFCLTFQLSAIESVKELEWVVRSDGCYRLTWQAVSSDEVRYLLFASMDVCFDPEEADLIAITSDCYVDVDRFYPYYRVVTEKYGCFSLPSYVIGLADAKGYERNPFVEDAVWNRVSPYFLPEDHPTKSVLDHIFSQARVSLSVKSMRKAGFTNVKPQGNTNVIVAFHPDLPGYVIKMYLDAQRYYHDEPEYDNWVSRIEGAYAIKREIEENDLGHLFKVPIKWIYPLPAEPTLPREYLRKNFVLIEDDMEIFTNKANAQKWKGKEITEELLGALYCLVKVVGISDGVKPSNIPFSQDGRIAFVDTQLYHQWPVKYHQLTPFLSPDMQRYWKRLTRRPH